MIDKETAELEKALEKIWDIAINKFHLDPFPVRFEIVPATVMYEIGSYSLPGRYSHWTFGKAYHKMKMMYDFGLSKIYEVVINTNPSYGFLLDTNSLLQNKLVIAHVLGHVDFFKNNAYFSHTNRQMLEEASVHADRIYDYEFKYGRKVVEQFLDSVLSIEEHIDPNLLIHRRRDEKDEKGKKKLEPEQTRKGRYDDLLSASELKARGEAAAGDQEERRWPAEPQKDLLFFIMENSPILEPWQRDIMAMIHSEMEYFVPQMQTKIMNEGWASYWHSRIMREMDLTDDEFVQFADLHSGVVSPHKGSLNPYYLGYKIFEDIERRWDSPTDEEKKIFGRKGGEGRAKIFEVRETENDVSFLRNYLTEQVIEDLDLFVYELVDEDEWTITEKRWERVRDQLVAGMTNFGFPYIEVYDADYNKNRELYLRHKFEGAELDVKYARKVLEYVHKLWGRDVHLETIADGESLVMHYDGQEHDED